MGKETGLREERETRVLRDRVGVTCVETGGGDLEGCPVFRKTRREVETEAVVPSHSDPTSSTSTSHWGLRVDSTTPCLPPHTSVRYLRTLRTDHNLKYPSTNKNPETKRFL